MEVTKLKWRNTEVYCLFTGPEYIFTNQYFGILAIARRSVSRDSFVVYYGNERTAGSSLGGDVCAELAERFIRKNENRYISHAIAFERHKKDLRAWSINCQTYQY